MQFSDLAIRNIKPPDTGLAYHWDDSGLGIRVSHTGTKTFCVLIGSGRRQTIGRYGTPPRGMTLGEARKECQRIQAEKTLGHVRPVHKAHDEARDEFLAEVEKVRRSRTTGEYKRLLTKHYAFGRTSVAAITPRMILAKINKLPPSERHHAYAAGRRFYRFCVSQSYINRSPMADMEPPTNPGSRKRVLSDTELGAVYKAAVDGETLFHHIIALCCLTAQRRGEIARFEREWRDSDLLTIPAEVAKNGQEHTFVLSEAAQRVLDDVPGLSNLYYFPAARPRAVGQLATVFNGWGKSKKAFDKELADKGHTIAPWQIKDLRRTVATGMAELDVPPHIVERLLNHVTGSRNPEQEGTMTQVGRVYNKARYLTQLREAVEKWQAHLEKLASEN